ncbi:MAG: hypothetical protein C0608_01450 [Deltaproteobacteria bacterium]|nr:MAG: hypothetical protein C0608_01450 [Deltaproteobacteria bacterium]
MKRFFKRFVVGSLALLCLLVVFHLWGLRQMDVITLSTYGHTLEPVSFFDRGDIAIIDKSGKNLITGVMGFQLREEKIYGWLTPPSRGHFMIFLDENRLESFDSFDSLGDLNERLLSLGLERSSMSKQVTFWDIRREGLSSVEEYLSNHPNKGN